MSAQKSNPWLHRYAMLTAMATLGLIGIGGLVTSHEAGLAVGDWPTSYGYGMFFLPIKLWQGGVFYEHTHRLWASTVGLLAVGLTRWLGGRASRRPLAVIGSIEVLAGLACLWLKPELKGAGHFLAGIGGVVLLAAMVWTRNQPEAAPLPQLGWLAFGLVQLQGLLGGLRVVLLNAQIGIVHATLAQLFFALTCVLALMTSRWWRDWGEGGMTDARPHAGPLPQERGNHRPACDTADVPVPAAPRRLRWIGMATTVLILGQLVLGATMRHQHAGLAIPDFPLAYGRFWPAMDPDSVLRYNQQRTEVMTGNPITAFQIELQMAHRLAALVILIGVAAAVWLARKQPPADSPVRRLAGLWLGLILVQAGLGAATIWTHKAADVTTAHVLVGALSLVTGVVWCLIAFRRSAPLLGTEPAPASFDASHTGPLATNPAVAAGK